MRENLDPMQQHGDRELIAALKKVQLWDVLCGLSLSLAKGSTQQAASRPQPAGQSAPQHISPGQHCCMMLWERAPLAEVLSKPELANCMSACAAVNLASSVCSGTAATAGCAQRYQLTGLICLAELLVSLACCWQQQGHQAQLA